MQFILIAAMIMILSSMGLILVRAFQGPTAYDRILAANIFGTCVVLAIALLSFISNNFMYLDMALLYGMINFIATIALLRFFKYRSFSHDQ